MRAQVPAGSKEFLLPIESLEHGVRKVLTYGTDAKIIGPGDLRDRLVEELGRVQSLYRL